MDDLSFTLFPGRAVVQFSQDNYAFSEAATSAQLVVTRAGDTSITSTLSYSTLDNSADVPCYDNTTSHGFVSARARCDFDAS